MRLGTESFFRSSKGSAVADVVIAAAMVIFVLLPVFSLTMEKYIMIEKSRIIRDAVDMANISAYNVLSTNRLGRADVVMDRAEILSIYSRLLGSNMRLDEDLNPEDGSVAEGNVKVESLEIYMGGFPVKCPSGATITRSTVHSCIQIPVKPSLYRKVISSMLGRDNIGISVHVDSEIPLNQ